MSDPAPESPVIRPDPNAKPPGRSYGGAFDGLIPLLRQLGVTPNMVSVAGLLFATAAAVGLALSAGHALPWEAASTPAPTSWWPVAVGLLLGLSAVCDLLDGALARGGQLQSNFGAVLDSTLDRFGDSAIFVGCAVYFASTGNATYVLISCLGLVAAVQISYVKARGENLVEGLGVGFWQRGERVVTLLLGAFFGRMPMALWVMAIFPLFTFLRRFLEVRRKLAQGERPGREELAIPRFLTWGPRRGTPAYVVLAVAITSALFLGPWVHPLFWGLADPLGALLGSSAGPR